MDDFIIPGEKPKFEHYKDEVVFIPNSALESNNSTLQDWLLMEITPEKYYEATIHEKSVYFKIEILLKIDN